MKNIKASLLQGAGLSRSSGLPSEPPPELPKTPEGDWSDLSGTLEGSGVRAAQAFEHDASEPNPLARSASSCSVWSKQAGDSEVGESTGRIVDWWDADGDWSGQPLNQRGSAPEAAVAAELPPKAAVAVEHSSCKKLEHQGYLDRDDVGNIGFFFGNWGKRSSCKDMAGNMSDQLRKNPCTIVGLAECDAATEDVMRGTYPEEAASGGGSAVADLEAFASRQNRNFTTIRHDEDSSNLLAIRQSEGTMEKLYWEAHFDGIYPGNKRADGTKASIRAYTRHLICRFTLNRLVGFYGNTVTVSNVHLHHKTANKFHGFTQAFKRFWERLAHLLRVHGVDVLLADLNMSLFVAIRELRSRGVLVTCLAWFPWVDSEGVASVDSCAIFGVQQVIEVRLNHDVSICTEDAERLSEGKAKGERGRELATLSMPSIKGPGQQFSCYLPKPDTMKQKIELLTFVEAVPAAAVAGTVPAVAGKGSSNPTGARRECLRFKEKRLNVDVWLGPKGRFYQGSHFPLATFTDNPCRRSEEKQKERRAKRSTKKKDKSAVADSWTQQEWQEWQGRQRLHGRQW